jgi:hypothetical protein
MCLAMLALQRVLLLFVRGVVVARLVRVDDVGLDVSATISSIYTKKGKKGKKGSLLVLLHHRLVHVAQRLHRKLDIVQQRIGARNAKVLAHHDAHQLQALAVRRHGVRRHHPAALAQLVRNGEFVKVVLVLGVEAEGHQRQAVAAALAHDQEAERLELVGDVVGRARQVEHDGAVAALAEADHLVVLPDDLRRALGEVEREAGLVRAEVVDVEDEFLREELGRAPHDPADTGVDLFFFQLWLFFFFPISETVNLPVRTYVLTR